MAEYAHPKADAKNKSVPFWVMLPFLVQNIQYHL